jgi:hypothetical protein
MRQTTSTTAEPKIVVRGADRLAEVWPDAALVPMWTRRASEVGHLDHVIELLARVDGVDTETYRESHGRDTASLNALAAHCEAAIIQAGLFVRGDLTPRAVLDELHRDLARERDVAVLLAS